MNLLETSHRWCHLAMLRITLSRLRPPIDSIVPQSSQLLRRQHRLRSPAIALIRSNLMMIATRSVTLRRSRRTTYCISTTSKVAVQIFLDLAKPFVCHAPAMSIQFERATPVARLLAAAVSLPLSLSLGILTSTRVVTTLISLLECRSASLPQEMKVPLQGLLPHKGLRLSTRV
jgi:hypothetical protein